MNAGTVKPASAIVSAEDPLATATASALSPMAATTASSAVWRCRRWSAWRNGVAFSTSARATICPPSASASQSASVPRSATLPRVTTASVSRPSAMRTRRSAAGVGASATRWARRRTTAGLMPGSSRTEASVTSDRIVTQSA